MSAFALPDLGEGLPDAEIVAWHVAVGDHVVADQPLVSVETAKAVVEIPSPHAGRIKRLCAAPGDRVRVGAQLVEFEAGPAPDTGAVVGELEHGAIAKPQAAAPLAVPAARTLARQRGIDLAAISGSGPGGAITVADVERAVPGSPGAAPSAQPPGGEALRGVRRAMALNMARSGAEVVPANVCDDADITAWPDGADVSARLVRAVVAGCAASPSLNAWYDGRALTRRLHARVDLGIAVDTEDGLIVPVLRDAGRFSADALHGEIARIKDAARARRTKLADLRDATFTLSNFGTLGGRYAMMAIVPPQVAILGAGRVRPILVPGDDGPRTAHVLPLSLTFDHRAVSGSEAARFLAAAIADLARAD